MQRHHARTAVVGAALAIALLLAVASRATAQPTADESKCQLGTSLAVSKFITDKAKCLIKCQQGARKSLNPSTDCTPSFGGATATCVQRATTKAEGLEQSKCTKGCPSCYSGGDCTADSMTRVNDAENQVDMLATLVYCDDSSSPDGLTAAEAKCADTVAKTLSTFAKAKLRCYSKCQKAAQKGTVSAAACTPPATDPATSACISKAEQKSTFLIDNKCESSQNSSADKPDCYGGSNGTSWTTLVESAVDGGQSSLYCGSPSGAFIDVQ